MGRHATPFFWQKMLPFFSLCQILHLTYVFRSLCCLVFKKAKTWGHRDLFLRYRAAKCEILAAIFNLIASDMLTKSCKRSDLDQSKELERSQKGTLSSYRLIFKKNIFVIKDYYM